MICPRPYRLRHEVAPLDRGEEHGLGLRGHGRQVLLLLLQVRRPRQVRPLAGVEAVEAVEAVRLVDQPKQPPVARTSVGTSWMKRGSLNVTQTAPCSSPVPSHWIHEMITPLPAGLRRPGRQSLPRAGRLASRAGLGSRVPGIIKCRSIPRE